MYLIDFMRVYKGALLVVYGYNIADRLVEFARFNGRDSIDERYNYRHINSVYPLYDEYEYKWGVAVEIADD